MAKRYFYRKNGLELWNYFSRKKHGGIFGKTQECASKFFSEDLTSTTSQIWVAWRTNLFSTKLANLEITGTLSGHQFYNNLRFFVNTNKDVSEYWQFHCNLVVNSDNK